jgi:inosine/xanthosine triphosphatase
MRVAVGSGNPVKRDATARIFVDSEVTAEPVASGVSEQPIGRPETRRGARTRAKRALAAGAYDFGVGLEGGVAGVEGADDDPVPGGDADAGTDRYLIMWAAVTDGDRWGVGGGPSYPLPDAIAARIRAGAELGPVMDDVLGASNVAENQGAAGALTGGRTTRTDALATAVAAAAGPFVTDLY